MGIVELHPARHTNPHKCPLIAIPQRKVAMCCFQSSSSRMQPFGGSGRPGTVNALPSLSRRHRRPACCSAGAVTQHLRYFLRSTVTGQPPDCMCSSVIRNAAVGRPAGAALQPGTVIRDIISVVTMPTTSTCLRGNPRIFPSQPDDWLGTGPDTGPRN